MNPAERLFIARYISNPKRNLFRFSFVFMVLGIVLSVGILSAALNLFEGYERALKDVLFDSFPHVRVQSQIDPYLNPGITARALDILRSKPEVESATPTASASLMTHRGKKVRGALLFAYDTQAGEKPGYSKFVIKGNPVPEGNQVIVGHYLADELNLALGDTLQATYPKLDRITPLGMYPGEHNLIISGIYSSGFYEYDRSIIISSMPQAEMIIGRTNAVNVIEVKLKDKYMLRANSYALAYFEELGNELLATPVIQTDLLKVVKMQKWLIFIILFFLVLIAGINVISSVGTQLTEKKNEIAVMKALGASSALIRRILGYQLLAVCFLSILMGQLFGYLLSLFVVKQNFYHLKGDVYFIDRLELYLSPFNQAAILSLGLILIILCIYLPLSRVDRMQIVDLLRNP